MIYYGGFNFSGLGSNVDNKNSDFTGYGCGASRVGYGEHNCEGGGDFYIPGEGSSKAIGWGTNDYHYLGLRFGGNG